MSSNLSFVRWSRRGRGGRKLEINIPPQQIHVNSKGGLINKGGVVSSEYGNTKSQATSYTTYETSSKTSPV